MLKKSIDKKAKAKVKNLLISAAAEKGLNLDDLMTDKIEDRLDDLLQAIIDDIGYLKLAKLGLGA